MTDTQDAVDHEHVLEQARAWHDAGKGVALATVVTTWGSAPRPVGSQLVVNDSSDFLGSVSGGCVEGAVIQQAQEIMQGGEPRMLEFGVSDDQAWEVGLACGGQVKIFVEALD